MAQMGGGRRGESCACLVRHAQNYDPYRNNTTDSSMLFPRLLECPSFLDGCCISTDKRINTDKQELQHTEHYYSIGFILIALGANFL